MSPILLIVCWLVLALATLLGLRLARSAARTRQLPETLMALFFLMGASVGYGSILLTVTFPAASPELLAALRKGSLAALQIPAAAIAIFTWTVFRRDLPWARSLAIGLACAVLGIHAVGAWIAPALALDALSDAPGRPLFWLANLAKAVCFLWAGSEALRYYGLAHRRLALGLADPLIVNRFLLWAVWSGATTVIFLIRIVTRLTVFPGEPVPLAIVLGQLGAGLVCFASIWLTFAPPAFYKRMVAPDADVPGAFPSAP